MMFPMNIGIIYSILFLAALTQCILGQKPTSFALMEVKSPVSTTDVCVNYQEFANGTVPEGPFRLMWWDFRVGNTAICQAPQSARRFGPNEMVPIKYESWPQHLEQQCQKYAFFSRTHQPIQYQAEIARKAGVKTLLFIMDRGMSNANGAHDYLHSQFCQPEVDGSNNGTVFFVYKDDFDKFVLPKLRETADVDFRFHKPEHRFDVAVILLWLLILVPMLLGALWSARAARDRMVRKGSLLLTRTDGIELRERGHGGETAESGGQKKPFLRTLCWGVMVVIVAIVLLVMYIRWSEVFVAVFWTVLGIFCMSKCLFALFKYLLFAKRRGQQRELLHFRSFRLTPLGLICYLVAAAICIPWFFVRKHPNAYLLLNLIDVAIAAYGIKYFTYEPMKKGPNLRGLLITSTFFLLLEIFFVVFYIIYPNAVECRTAAPVDLDEEQGGSFFVPMLNDPLSVCWDTQIEKGHRHAVAAMIVVIFSAYFLPFWFLVDFVNEYKAFPYGIVVFSVYAIALLICLLVSMFFNLHLQYFMLLMPVPVWAGTIFSLIKGTFSQLFKGQLRFD